MSYTNPWNLSIPPTTDQAKNIALDMRTMKLDLQDRMNGVFVQDWSKDPIVPQASILGNVIGKTLNLSGAMFIPNFSTGAYGDSSKQSVTRNSGSITTIGGSNGVSAQPPNLFCSFPLPNGVTPTSFGFTVTNSNIPCSCRLWVLNTTTGIFGSSQVITLGASIGVQTLLGAIAPIAGTTQSSYTLEVFSSNPAGQNISYTLMAGYIVYSTPDCRFTL